MSLLDKTKNAYDEILNAMQKYSKLCSYDIEDYRRRAELHLFGLELKETYGINIDPTSVCRLNWVPVCDNVTIARFGEKYNRTISSPDGGTQPEDELLLTISFPSGAYVFGDDYPLELFLQFFNKLVTLEPKYTDIRNNSLFYAMNVAGHVYNKYLSLYKDFNELAKKEEKQRAIKKLQERIKQLRATE